MQSKKYGAIYKQYKAGKITREQAEKQIAQVYGTGETDSVSHATYRQLYSDRYAGIWDAEFPDKPKNFRAP